MKYHSFDETYLLVTRCIMQQLVERKVDDSIRNEIFINRVSIS